MNSLTSMSPALNLGHVLERGSSSCTCRQLVRPAAAFLTKRSAPHMAEALEFQRGPAPQPLPSWTGSECPISRTVAVPKRAQELRDAFSDTGQQEAHADQGSKRDDKSDCGGRERWRRHRRKIRHGDICLTHGKHLQQNQLVLEKRQWRRSIVPLGGSSSVGFAR